MFLSAIFLLVFCGVAAFWAFYEIYSGEKWVRHTDEVESRVGDMCTGIRHCKMQ
jgi:hypothetical protein